MGYPIVSEAKICFDLDRTALSFLQYRALSWPTTQEHCCCSDLRVLENTAEKQIQCSNKRSFILFKTLGDK